MSCGSGTAVESSNSSGRIEEYFKISNISVNSSSFSTLSRPSADASRLINVESRVKVMTALARHLAMVRLMNFVYAAIPFNVESGVSRHAGHDGEAANSGVLNTHSQQDTSQIKSKKRTRSRNSSPPDSNDGRRKRRIPLSKLNIDQNRHLACPFNKYDPVKYCGNISTGSKYRTCASPGFSDIRRLKWVCSILAISMIIKLTL